MKELFTDIFKGLGVVLILVIIASLFLMLIATIFTPIMVLSCNAATSQIGLPHKYDFLAGCMVQESGNWIPLDNWRYVGNK